MARLGKIARVVRSKNAGALNITLDIMFDDLETFERVIASGAISPQVIARLYAVEVAVVEIIPYPVANAIKITLPRKIPSGDPGDGDVYGAQQHAPLLSIEIP